MRILNLSKGMLAKCGSDPRDEGHVLAVELACILLVSCTYLSEVSCAHEHMDSKLWILNGHGWWVWLRWPTKYTICDACRPYHSILSTLKAVFCRDLLLLQLAQIPRSPDLVIFVLTPMTTTRLITLPLAHAHGVIICVHDDDNDNDDMTDYVTPNCACTRGNYYYSLSPNFSAANIFWQES